jgi:hypothetical protein
VGRRKKEGEQDRLKLKFEDEGRTENTERGGGESAGRRGWEGVGRAVPMKDEKTRREGETN